LRAQAKLAHDAHDPVLQISKKTMNYQMLVCVGSILPCQNMVDGGVPSHFALAMTPNGSLSNNVLTSVASSGVQDLKKAGNNSPIALSVLAFRQ